MLEETNTSTCACCVIAKCYRDKYSRERTRSSGDRVGFCRACGQGWFLWYGATAVLTGGRPAILKLVRETLQLSAHTAAIHNRAPPPLPGLARQLALAWLTLAAAETLGLPAAPRTT